MEVLAVNNIIKLGSNGLKAQKITALSLQLKAAKRS